MTTSSEQKPVILMVTGAWHRPFFYDPLGDALKAKGYEWLCPELASMGADKHGVTWEADVSLIRSIAIPIFEQDREVVLIGHSYGGIPACASTEGLGVAERAAEGKKGGFRSIIYLAAFAIPQRGMDLLQTFGGSWAPWQNFGVPYTKNQLITANEKGKEAFYNDVPETTIRKYWDRLVPHSQDAFETPVDFVVSDLIIPKGYLVCELDQALPTAIQDQLSANGGFKAVERIHAGHSSFMSRTAECAELLAKMIEEL